MQRTMSVTRNRERKSDEHFKANLPNRHLEEDFRYNRFTHWGCHMILYQNMLQYCPCGTCSNRERCFLRRIPLQNYPATVQNFVIFRSPVNYNIMDNHWHMKYLETQFQLVCYYNEQVQYMPIPAIPPIMWKRQQDQDKQNLCKQFKRFVDVAARATEDQDPALSIMFDGIGLILASDYLEAIHKTLSMIKTYEGALWHAASQCPHYLL